MRHDLPTLSHPLPVITAPDGRRCYGGAQNLLPKKSIQDTWVAISSWGGEYYINREEYDRFSKKHSSGWLCNLILLRRTDAQSPESA